ncbi:12448_t:CDS:1 [Funneliformis geosporum]|uniref:12448_t:CDS:1 n=1 Tax=Funneliformis geosporum TaxID=1117311 RepID=A0A9W4SBC0_9GLOM|nr:12448_t:CDS:1 [Funneliformis geosporum]
MRKELAKQKPKPTSPNNNPPDSPPPKPKPEPTKKPEKPDKDQPIPDKNPQKNPNYPPEPDKNNLPPLSSEVKKEIINAENTQKAQQITRQKIKTLLQNSSVKINDLDKNL